MRAVLLAVVATLPSLFFQANPLPSAEENTGAKKERRGDAIDTKFLRDYAATRGFMLGRPTQVKPTPDGKAVLFLRSPPRSPKMHLYEFDVETKKTRELLTPEQLLKGAEEKLTPEEKARRERMRITARGFANYELSEDGSLILLSLSGKLYTYGRTDGAVRELPTCKGTLIDPKLSPDAKSVAYVLDHDVYVMDLETMKERRLTSGGTEDVSHGLAEFVAQEEMGRFSGYWWSPDSQWIAYQESDAREVEVWRAADPAKPGEEPHAQRYPRPGKNNVKVRLGIISAEASGRREPAENATTWVDWDREKYPYMATVKWDKGGPLTILVQTRKQQEIVLLAVDAKTGKTTALLKERDPTWLNLDQDVPLWLEDGSGFFWTAERSRHCGPELELHDPKGGEERRLLAGSDFSFHGLLSVDEKLRQVYYLGSKTSPTESHIFRFSFRDQKEGIAQPVSVQVTREPGLHTAVFAKDHSIYVHRFTGAEQMPRSRVHKSDGTFIAELPSVAEEPPFIPRTEYCQLGERIKSVREAVPTQVEFARFCSITRPRSFDAKIRYPVIVDVYGGPGHQHVVASMASRLRAQWLADQGFIVVAIDGRGTPRRGRDWERSIHGSFGKIPLEDQVNALQELGKKYPELDLNRVGITGWSFGGYMSALAVMKRPDVFKAAVAGAPVTDWEDYDTHYTERYLGLPQDNPAGYKESSLLTYAHKLERPLLVIHGTADDNVFFLHSLKLSDALFRAGKEHEVLPLTGLTHMVPDPLVRERLEERIVRFFRKHL